MSNWKSEKIKCQKNSEKNSTHYWRRVFAPVSKQKKMLCTNLNLNLKFMILTSSSSLLSLPVNLAHKCWTLGSFRIAFLGSTTTLSHTACKQEQSSAYIHFMFVSPLESPEGFLVILLLLATITNFQTSNYRSWYNDCFTLHYTTNTVLVCCNPK